MPKSFRIATEELQAKKRQRNFNDFIALAALTIALVIAIYLSL